MDNYYMSQAIAEAKKGFRQTYTNPLVGAVIVKDNHVIARGAHLQYGHEHAEKNAILHCQTPEELVDSTLYEHWNLAITGENSPPALKQF